MICFTAAQSLIISHPSKRGPPSEPSGLSHGLIRQRRDPRYVSCSITSQTKIYEAVPRLGYEMAPTNGRCKNRQCSSIVFINLFRYYALALLIDIDAYQQNTALKSAR